MTIKERHFGPDHYQVAITLVNLGNAYGDLGDAAQQRDLLTRALTIQERHFGPDHYQVASTLVSLGNAYGALGDVTKKARSAHPRLDDSRAPLRAGSH